MSINSNQQINSSQTNIKAPSITYIDFKYKQDFFKKNIDKISVRFEREEDMLVLFLSIFIHDFAHDFNFSGMYSRIIKGNKSLFDSLGIKIGNSVLKKWVFLPYGPRDIYMYDDSKYVNKEDDSIYMINKNKYNKILETYELPLTTVGGEKISNTPEVLPKILEEPLEINKSNEELEKEKEKESEQTLEPESVFELNKPITTDIMSNLYSSMLDKYTNDADFLAFYSQLNIYVVTYLDCKELTKEYNNLSDDVKRNNFYNVMMYNAIISTLNYIISSFEKDVIEDYNQENEELIRIYGDFFSILKHSFIYVSNKKNKNLQIDCLEILNSKQVLQQFIVYYGLYLTIPSIEEFNNLVKPLQEGDLQGGDLQGGTNEDEEVKNINSNPVFTPINQLQESTSSSPIIEPTNPEVKVENLTEQIGVTHNNLMTTLARGIFQKTGIWQNFWEKNGKEIKQFDKLSISKLTFDSLKKIYSTDITTPNGHLNNELLIVEILILKDLLLEISPLTMYIVGAKIDDRLKDYMDAFYYANYGLLEKGEEKDKTLVDDEIKEVTEFIDNIEQPKTDEEAKEITGDNPDDDIIDNPFFGGTKNSNSDINETNEGEQSLKKQKTDENEEVKNDEEITDTPNFLPPIPVIIENLEIAYNLNNQVIEKLIESQIEPISIQGTNKKLNNMFDVLKYNQVLMQRKNDDGTFSNFSIPAPRMKFIINNAAKISSNFNGIKLTMPSSVIPLIKETLNKFIDENGELTFKTKNIDNMLLKNQSSMDNVLDNIKTLRDEIKDIKDEDIKEKLQNQMKTIIRNQRIPLQNDIELLEKFKELGDEDGIKKYLINIKSNHEKWFKGSQAAFGLYKSLNRGVFCPASSMMDAMDNCSLKYNSSEPKEVGTTNFELIYTDGDKRVISYGGTVLYYNQEEPKQLNANIDFRVVCNNTEREDIAIVNTNDIKVSESRELNARIAYKGVIEKIKTIFKDNYQKDTSDDTELEGINTASVMKAKMINKLYELWNGLQYIKGSPQNFNNLLASTAIKTLGDFLQECQGTVKWGGYVNTSDLFEETSKNLIKERNIEPIYRSVSDRGIIPYNKYGDALRLCIQGDRPSGFRSIYILLNAIDGVNEHSVTGYVYTMFSQKPSRTLLVTRNKGIENQNKLKGNVIFVTPNPEPNRFSINLETTNIAPTTLRKENISQEIPSNIIKGTQKSSLMTKKTSKSKGSKPYSYNKKTTSTKVESADTTKTEVDTNTPAVLGGKTKKNIYKRKKNMFTKNKKSKINNKKNKNKRTRKNNKIKNKNIKTYKNIYKLIIKKI